MSKKHAFSEPVKTNPLANPKGPILGAYHSMLSRLDAKNAKEQIPPKKELEKQVLEKVSDSAKLTTEISQFKTTMLGYIDSLNGEVTAAFERLKNIKAAVTLEQDHLNELHGIKEAANTLSALILAHQEEKETFEAKMNAERTEFSKKMSEEKASWEKQRENLTAEYKALTEQVEKERAREEEEYKILLATKRRKEEVEYASRKQKLEKLEQEFSAKQKGLIEREKSVSGKECEFTELQKKIQSFGAVLEKAKEDAVKSTRETLEKEFKSVTDLKVKEVENKAKGIEQKNASLEKKIKEQEQLILQLTQVADAFTQIQQIASRARDISSQKCVPLMAHQEEKQSS